MISNMCAQCTNLKICKVNLIDCVEESGELEKLMKDIPDNFILACKYYSPGYLSCGPMYPAGNGFGRNGCV